MGGWQTCLSPAKLKWGGQAEGSRHPPAWTSPHGLCCPGLCEADSATVLFGVKCREAQLGLGARRVLHNLPPHYLGDLGV